MQWVRSNSCGMKKYVIYTRVSTLKQGESGLGLKAQRASIDRYLAGQKPYELLGEFQDDESGATLNREGLTAAITLCKKEDATLVLAKLDRLSRDFADLVKLRKEVKILDVESPNTSALLFAVKAGMAQEERELIASRTKAALRRKIEIEGAYINNPLGKGLEEARKRSAKVRGKKAQRNEDSKRALFVTELIIRYCEATQTPYSWEGISNALNEIGFLSPSGKEFSRGSLYALYQRGREYDYFKKFNFKKFTV